MRATQPANSHQFLGGGLIQPMLNEKPVKKISCQPNGLKNQGRSESGRISALNSSPNVQV